MTTSFVFSALCMAAIAGAMPSKRWDNGGAPTEVEILNFALTLEHLENAFYTQGLQKYSQQDFIDEGLPNTARGWWEQIAQHECTHVEFLTDILGEQAVKPCEYKLCYLWFIWMRFFAHAIAFSPDTDPKSFAAVSFMLETVGVSAYSGAAHLLQNSDSITASAAILAVEARQSAWINSAVLGANPWNTAFDSPLDLNQVYTLASGVIVSCPADNMKLPVKAFPALTFPAGAKPGDTVQISYNATASESGSLFVAFIGGLQATIVPLDSDKKVTIPTELRGVVFAIVVSDANKVDDSVTVAGPAFLPFQFDFNNQTQASG
ncbi:ferritin-like domain-containing protein [Hygrophoropsis aurantiaca]|uniref:Ferritin-like domain-containing protein n=1 Tax=Hygrophoropsis aurantiaca TaxID=72124 RepID=A0ACB7ZYF6_9AGAM|nr:ferritin-like domain-containing protein [Hygrophoropsis aurantiaca]